MEDSAQAAYQKILRCISAREQSSKRMQEKLSRAGFSDGVIDEALDKALRIGIIDDRRYANALIYQTLSTGKGLRFTLNEIEELGIDPYELDAYQEYLNDEEQTEDDRALKFLKEHPPKSKNLRDSAYRKLINKGYSSSVASSAARLFCENL